MFVFNEGSLDIPKDWKDDTINMLSSTGDGSSGFTLVVNRDHLPWGMTFQEYAGQEIDKAKETLAGFNELHNKSYTVGNREAHVVEYQWKSQQGRVHQIVVMVNLPEKILIFTASTSNKMSDGQKRHFEHIIKSFKESPTGNK